MAAWQNHGLVLSTQVRHSHNLRQSVWWVSAYSCSFPMEMSQNSGQPFLYSSFLVFPQSLKPLEQWELL